MESAPVGTVGMRVPVATKIYLRNSHILINGRVTLLCVHPRSCTTIDPSSEAHHSTYRMERGTYIAASVPKRLLIIRVDVIYCSPLEHWFVWVSLDLNSQFGKQIPGVEAGSVLRPHLSVLMGKIFLIAASRSNLCRGRSCALTTGFSEDLPFLPRN